jgi:hypothetical protein
LPLLGLDVRAMELLIAWSITRWLSQCAIRSLAVWAKAPGLSSGMSGQHGDYFCDHVGSGHLGLGAP